MEKLYIVTSSESVRENSQWLHGVYFPLTCNKCNLSYLKDMTKVKDLVCEAAYSIPKKHVLSVGFFTHILVAHKVFLEIFEDELAKNFIFGKLSDGLGNVYEDYKTFTSDKVISIRAKQAEYYGQCESCGHHRYIVKGWPNIWRESLRNYDNTIYQTTFNGRLLMPESLVSKIDKKWKGIHAVEVPVVDAPLDGFDLPAHME